jgi:hypothetical protein
MRPGDANGRDLPYADKSIDYGDGRVGSRQHNGKSGRGGPARWEVPMQEWLLVIAPLTLVLYFLIFPEQLGPAWDCVAFATQWVMACL